MEKDSIPLSGWNVDSRTTFGNYSLASSESELSLGLDQGIVDDRITILNTQLPNLNLSDYNYISINMNGTNNALVLFRIFFEDGTFVDIAFWESLIYFKPLINVTQSGTMRGDAYIALVSSDGNPCSSTFYEISFIRTE